jgi:hypothetical protein
VRNESQRTEDTKKPQHFNDWDINTRCKSIYETRYYNEAVELVPSLSQVRVLIHDKAASDNLVDHFACKENLEEQVNVAGINDLKEKGLKDRGPKLTTGSSFSRLVV